MPYLRLFHGLWALTGPQTAIYKYFIMKRFLNVLVLMVMALSCVKGPSSISVKPSEIDFPVSGGDKAVSVRCDGDWTVSYSADWFRTTRKSGSGNATVTVIADPLRGTQSRSAVITFTAGDLNPVSLVVNQTFVEEKFYPDPASGITLEPSVPNADEPCVIKFMPFSGNPLYNHAGELYAHLGVIVEDEWLYVPCEWAVSDEKVHFTKVGDNHWELELKPTVREYFNSGDTPVKKIAMIVRSEDGNIKSHNDDQFCTVVDDKYDFEAFVPDEVVHETMPAGAGYGININSDNSVTFVFYDKDNNGASHDYCYVVGDWNNWERNSGSAMKRDDSAGCWWTTVSGFDPDKEYRFQYRLGWLGSDIRVSDPYSRVVYDQWNDKYISWAPEFPQGAKALVSAFKINEETYSWKVDDFKIADRNNLIIYEMHFRDFSATSDIAGAEKYLDYIANLGVNAVELMPVQEFDGNDSWGYNPNHWFALDKAYGRREDYKRFIDGCHERGLAVIVDVVYNHATGSHPWAKLWWDSSASCTAENNPWFNMAPMHPYNVYHDMNHENDMVRQTVKESLGFLLEEYKVDGFRFDLTKGFTQKMTDPNVSEWGHYDQSRVDILEDYADYIWSVNKDAAVIFEHLSDWDEEKVLAEHGIQLWRNVNGEYRNAMKGNGNLTNMWSNSPFGGYVGYMESHDEERLCYGVTPSETPSDVSWGICGTLTSWGENPDIAMSADGPFFVARNVSFTASDLFKIRGNSTWNDAYNYGAATKGYKLPLNKAYELSSGSSSKDMAAPAAGSYDVYFCPDVKTIWVMETGTRPQEPSIGDNSDILAKAMRRAECCAAFFLTVPGPKMIWQFGELGYDYSIDFNDRVGRKPVVTDRYFAQPERRALYDTYASLLKFRKDNPEFFASSASFSWNPTAATKTITCSAGGRSFHVVGNFANSAVTYTMPAGTWKDYQTGETVGSSLTLQSAEYRLFVNF